MFPAMAMSVDRVGITAFQLFLHQIFLSVFKCLGSCCGKGWVHANMELPMDHVSITWIIQTFVNDYLGSTSAFLGGEKAPSTLSIVCTTLTVLADHIHPLLMPWVPFSPCPLGLDHAGSHSCALGYFPFGHWAFFCVLMKLPFIIWWKCWRKRLSAVGLRCAGKCRHPPPALLS